MRSKHVYCKKWLLVGPSFSENSFKEAYVLMRYAHLMSSSYAKIRIAENSDKGIIKK